MITSLIDRFSSILPQSNKKRKTNTTRNLSHSFASSSSSSSALASATYSALASTSATSSHRPTLTVTPPAVLALICQHLQVADILRLLRCCSHLRLLNDDDAFSGVAWSAARLELRLNTELHEWALPYHSCIHDPASQLYDRHIPLSLWQQARPVLVYTQQQWHNTAFGSHAQSEERLRMALAIEQPTRTIRVGDEQNVVLNSVSWSNLFGLISRGAPCFRGRFVLTATPHLQHLHVVLDVDRSPRLRLQDIVTLVPRLRSLHVEKNTFDSLEPAAIPTRAILDALPLLTQLSLVGFYLTAQEWVDIAAHVTLEHIHLHTQHAQQRDEDGLRGSCTFHTDGEGCSLSLWLPALPLLLLPLLCLLRRASAAAAATLSPSTCFCYFTHIPRCARMQGQASAKT